MKISSSPSRRSAKQSGGQGWADVWYKGHFAIEYKGPHGDLDKAYSQLLQYRESLENPPLLIVSNIQSLTIHTNFTGTAKKIITITLDDLLTPQGLQQVRSIFYNVEAFRPEKTAAQVTEEAAARFAHLAEHLRKWGYSPHEIAHSRFACCSACLRRISTCCPTSCFRAWWTGPA